MGCLREVVEVRRSNRFDVGWVMADLSCVTGIGRQNMRRMDRCAEDNSPSSLVSNFYIQI